MFCPRCKNEIKDKSLKCSVCGAKIGSLCSDCGHYNLINAVECSNCGKTLLKLCEECGAANFPDAEVCRKCGTYFPLKKNKEDNLPVYSAKSSSQHRIKSMLIEGIKNPDLKIITLSGSSGVGKNLVLRYTISELTGAKLIWMMGTCSQMTQLSPFGYFQDLLLNFFNINNFCPDTLQLKRNSIKFFRQDFPTLSYEETLDLLNLLYPNSTDIYENIYYNKAKMFTIMKKVITTIVEKMKVIFIIDKFENIDGMSFDFIKELLKDDLILSRAKFILVCNEPKPGLGLITSPELKNENYLDLTIAQFTKSQTAEFLKQYKDEIFDSEFVNLADKIGQGIPGNIEQMVLLKKEIARLKLKNIEYNSIESVVEYRLKILMQENIRAYRLLAALSVLGCKVYPAALEMFDNSSPEAFESNINYLVSAGFITQINNLSFEFKTDTMWKSIVSVIKNDTSFVEILNTVYDILKSYQQSSPALLAYISQKLEDSTQAFNTWTLLMKYASYIGDIGLYIIVQKQALKLIENKNNDFYRKVKKNIYTRVGKLLEPIDYKTSLEYLQNAVMMLDDNEESEHIELLGYISSCSMQAGNYFGVIECVENVLNKLPETMPFEKILVKSRMIKPLLRLGNYGQLINAVEVELFPEIEKVLSKGRDIPQISIKELFELWLDLYFDLAEALTFQGDNRAFEVIQTLCEVIEKNSTTTEPAAQCKMYLLLALANTLKGDITTSKRILEDILKEYSLDSMDNFIVSRWNFIDILNKFFEKDYVQMQSELFNVVTFANNINDNFTKNILKTLLAKIFKSNNQAKKALEILDKQVAYFAKEKIATGVLLCWYLIAEIKLVTKGTQFALDIATKALDIAQETNINNYYFMTLFNKLIGEIYTAKQDFESAKVYFEKALFLAKKFDLEYIQIQTYIQCSKLYQELALPKTSSRNIFIKKALKMFQTMKTVPVVSNNNFYQNEIKEELSILTSFCRLNGISFKREEK